MNLPVRLQRVLVPRKVVRDGQVLSPEIQLMLGLQKVARLPAVETLPLDRARREIVHQSRLVGGRQSVGALRELEVDGAEGRLSARLYIPTERTGADPAPTLMFFHGGGWIYGDLDSHDAVCRFLAERSGVQVLAVDYRLSPEHPFPAAVEDCRTAYRWLVEHADDVNADPERLAVGGDSAGGNLAAVTAVWAAKNDLPLAFQLLVYPGTDFVGRSPSRLSLNHGFFLTEEFMNRAEDLYFGSSPEPAGDRAKPAGDRAESAGDRAESAGDRAKSVGDRAKLAADRAKSRSHPDASPLQRTDFPDGIARAHVVTAGFDPLRDEGEAYADLLEKHGVQVSLTRYPGLIHSFFNIVGAGHDCPAAVGDIADTLRSALD
jgi:acetyl esterase